MAATRWTCSPWTLIPRLPLFLLSCLWPGAVVRRDIQSERLWALGSARFTLGTVLGSATLHTYRPLLLPPPATVEPAACPCPWPAKGQVRVDPGPSPSPSRGPLTPARQCQTCPCPCLSLPLTSPGSPEPLPILSLNGGAQSWLGTGVGLGDAPLSPGPTAALAPGTPKAAQLTHQLQGLRNGSILLGSHLPTPWCPGSHLCWGTHLITRSLL